MKTTLCTTLLRTAFTLSAAIAGLTAASPALPTAHAAAPSLSVTGQGGSVLVTGAGFTPNVPVRLVLLNSSLTLDLGIQYVTPFPNGSFQMLLVENTTYSGGAEVAADQSGLPTTWAQTTIYAAPYITAQGGVGDVSVDGSGFAPGTSVTVKVFQWYGCTLGGHLALCTRVLGTQTVAASSATSSDPEAGLIIPYLLFGAPAGNTVDVQASGTSIVTNSAASSNVVSVNVP